MSIAELFDEKNEWTDLKIHSLQTTNVIANSVFNIGSNGTGILSLNSNQTYTSSPSQLVNKLIFFNSDPLILYTTILTVPSGDAFVQYFLTLLKISNLPLGFYFDLILKIEKNVGGNAASSVRLFMPDVNYFNQHQNGVDSHVDNLEYYTNSQSDVTQVIRFGFLDNQIAGYPTWFVY